MTGGGLLRAVRRKRLWSKLLYVFDRQWRSAQDKQTPYFRGDRRTQRVESLRQIQAAGCRFGFPQQVHVGIGRHLKTGNSRGENKQRGQEQRIRNNRCGRYEQ